MVQKSKGGKKCRSVKKGRTVKDECKYHRKENYRKHHIVKEECNICYESVPTSVDNSVICGKVTHCICSSCKSQMDDAQCPMCRSHKIVMGKDMLHALKVVSKGGRFGKNTTYQDRLDVRYMDGGADELWSHTRGPQRGARAAGMHRVCRKRCRCRYGCSLCRSGHWAKLCDRYIWRNRDAIVDL